jgi:hypothetical protein
MVSVLFPLTVFPLWGLKARALSRTAQVTVSIYNHAGVPATILDGAERRAASILESANFDVVWLHCVRPSNEDAIACKKIDLPGHLALRIIPDVASSMSDAAFGVTFLAADGTGKYSDVFWKRAVDLHATSSLDLGSVLGSVIAHELGHLLLGSHAHAVSGIMRTHWEAEELRRIAMGTLLFTPKQAKIMRGKTWLLEATEQSVANAFESATSVAIAITPRGNAHAQTMTLKAHVPFPFVVGNQTLPAGTYQIQRLLGRPGEADQIGMIVVRSIDPRVHQAVVTNLVHPSPGSRSSSQLMFARKTGQRYLSEVRTEGEKGHRVPNAPQQSELLGFDASQEQVVLAALH